MYEGSEVWATFTNFPVDVARAIERMDGLAAGRQVAIEVGAREHHREGTPGRLFREVPHRVGTSPRVQRHERIDGSAVPLRLYNDLAPPAQHFGPTRGRAPIAIVLGSGPRRDDAHDRFCGAHRAIIRR